MDWEERKSGVEIEGVFIGSSVPRDWLQYYPLSLQNAMIICLEDHIGYKYKRAC